MTIQNVISHENVMLLHDIDEKYKFNATEYDKQRIKTSISLADAIRSINLSTAIKTFLSDNVTPCHPEFKFPIGLGLIRPDISHLDDANSDIINLFSRKINYSEYSPYEKITDPQDPKTDFIALFWANDDKICSTLDEVLRSLHEYKNLCSLLRTVYIPLLCEIFQLTQDVVLQSPTEIIYYPDSGISGLEQHIDSVKRTGDVLGPICSINLVGSRKMDMLPCFVQDSLPFRIETFPGDLLILDSVARTLWSHAVPYGSADERYSIVIRPICDGSQFGNPIARAEVLDVDVYSCHSALVPSGSQPTKITQKKDAAPKPAQSIPGSYSVDFDMNTFWKEKGLSKFKFFKSTGMPSSSRDMETALLRNVQIQDILQTHPTLWEAYGHDGADTLSFLWSFENQCHITTVCEDARSRCLTQNIAGFRQNMQIYKQISLDPVNLDIKMGKFQQQCTSIESNVGLLYIDPKWTDDITHREYNVLEMCQLINNEIFIPLATKLHFIQALCFKVRHDWPLFKRVVHACDLHNHGFRHVKTMDVTSPSKNAKHHYFHLLVKPPSDDDAPAKKILFNVIKSK